MTRARASFAALLVLAASAAATSAQAGTGARRVAVVVGSNHAMPGRATLRYAHNDAQAVAEVLTQVGDFAPSDVTVMLDPDPDRVLEELDGKLAGLRAQGGETLLLFYYSGHADEQALLTHGQALSLQALRKRLEAPEATVRVGIIDACRGGSWTRAKGLRAEKPFEVDVPFELASEGSVLIAASSGLENAHETDALRGSFFTHHLVSALRGAASRRGDGRVTLGEAFAYAQQLTIRDTAAQTDSPQHPSFNMNLRGRQDLVLARAEASAGLVELEQREGPTQVIRLDNGLVVLEVPPGKRKMRLALPSGRYLVRRKSAAGTFAKELFLEANKPLTIDEESLELVGSPALSNKGDEPLAPLEPPGLGRRIEVGVSVATMLFTMLTDQQNLSAHAAYNLSDNFAVELLGGLALGRQTGLAEQLRANFAANPSVQVATDLSNLWVMNGPYGALGVRWTPGYGRVQSPQVRFLPSLRLAVGGARLQQESAVVCLAGSPVTCDAFLTQSKPAPIATAALGLRFLAGRHAIELELRSYSFPDSYLREVDRAAAKSGQQSGTASPLSFTHVSQAELGYSFLF